jgi:hypothetical protein
VKKWTKLGYNLWYSFLRVEISQLHHMSWPATLTHIVNMLGNVSMSYI